MGSQITVMRQKYSKTDASILTYYFYLMRTKIVTKNNYLLHLRRITWTFLIQRESSWYILPSYGDSQVKIQKESTENVQFSEM